MTSMLTYVLAGEQRTPCGVRGVVRPVRGPLQRRVEQRDLGSQSPGRHLISLGQDAHLAPGIYSLRLTQAGRSVSSKVVFVR